MTTELRDILMKDTDAALTPASRDETVQLKDLNENDWTVESYPEHS